MTPDQAIAEAQAQNLRPVYLVLGEERHLQSAVVAALRTAALAGGIPGLNEDQLTAGDHDVDAVLSAARTLPMMGKRRLVMVRSLERWEPKAEGGAKSAPAPLDRLVEYVESPAPTTILVLVASKLDKRRRLVTAATKAGFLVSCEELARAELPQWISRTAKSRGHRLAAGVADLIAELAGPELSAVADALERVCLFVGSGAEVTEDAVAECIVRLRPTTVWELVAAVGRRDVAGALSALHSVYDPQDRGLRLVGVLAWSARQLIKFEAALRGGAPPPEAAKQAGAPPFKARELTEQIKRMPRSELERWLEVLAAVDLALKGGSKRHPRAILEHAVIQLCGERPTGAVRPAGHPIA